MQLLRGGCFLFFAHAPATSAVLKLVTHPLGPCLSFSFRAVAGAADYWSQVFEVGYFPYLRLSHLLRHLMKCEQKYPFTWVKSVLCLPDANCNHAKRCWPTSFVWKNFQIQKCSSEGVECSFDHPAETFLPKVQKTLARSPRKGWKTKIFQKKSFSVKMFIWTRRMNSAVTLSPKVRTIFFAKSENDRNTFF